MTIKSHVTFVWRLLADACLKVLSLLTEVCACVCGWVGAVCVEKKNGLFHVLPTRGPLVLTCLLAKIASFDSRFSEICSETDLTKHLFFVCFCFIPISPSREWKKHNICKNSENIGTDLFDLHKWHMCYLNKGGKKSSNMGNGINRWKKQKSLRWGQTFDSQQTGGVCFSYITHRIYTSCGASLSVRND